MRRSVARTRNGLWLLTLVLWSVASLAEAQELPLWLRVRSVPAELSGPVSEPPSAERAQARRDQNRARRLLGASAGLVLSGAVTPIYVLRNREACDGSSDKRGRPPLIAAGVVGTLGIVGVVATARWLARETKPHGSMATTGQRVLSGGLGLVTFALTQAVMAPLFVLDQVCNS